MPAAPNVFKPALTPAPARAGQVDLARSSPLRLRTILVPTDFSPASDRALDYAKRLARPFGASLRVLNVFEPMAPPHGDFLGRWLLENKAAARARSRREMDVFVNVALSHETPRGEFDFRVGRAYQEIVRAAEEQTCDLIVLAAHGYSRLTRWLLGSTAERVLRLAPCPVLVVQESES